MTLTVLEALVVLISGVLCLAYALAGTNALRVASIVGAILTIVIAAIWLAHAGA